MHNRIEYRIKRHAFLRPTMSTGSSYFYGNYLKKKVHKNEWKDFWVVLKGKWLFFLKEKGDESTCGVLELSEISTCTLVRPTGKYRAFSKVEEYNGQGSDRCKGFKFRIRSKHGFHLFKSHSLGECQRWIRSISNSVKILQDPSYAVEIMAREDLTNHSDEVNISQDETGDSYCFYSVNDTNRRTCDGKTSHRDGDVSIRGRLRRSFRSLRVLKSEFSGNVYGELK